MNTLMSIAKQTAEAHMSDKPFVCKYCDRAFSKEKTLFSHMCEQKRRWLQEKDKHVQLGLQAYLRFYEKTQGANGSKKTYGDFVNSPYYNAFVKFGKHLVNIKAINVSKFIDYVINNNTKLDQWCQDKHYQAYLTSHLKVESWQDAISRSLKTMEAWADENKVQLKSYFIAANTNRVCQHIVNGRISTWVVFNCDTGTDFLGKISQEQLAMIYEYIDPDFWKKNFIKYHHETAIVKSALKEAGL